MADCDVENVDSFPADCEQIERGIARVRFSDAGIEHVNFETSYEVDESEMVAVNDDEAETVNDDETILTKLSLTSTSDSDVSSNKTSAGHKLSSFLKSATVSAVTDYDESEDATAARIESLGEKSKSSPEISALTGYKSEVEKMLSPHMDVTRILDHLYLSDFVSLSPSRLSELGVTLVVNATYEIPNVDVPEGTIEFIKLEINDSVTADMAQHMDRCADRIHEVRSAGGAALVHCALGISRSVTICLAYLVKHEGRTLREAYFELKKKRPIIRPNEGFWRQLISFEISKRGRATVKLSVYPMGVIPDVYRGAPQTVKTRRYHVSALETLTVQLSLLNYILNVLHHC